MALEALRFLDEVLSRDNLELECLDDDLEGAKDDILDGDRDAFNEDIMKLDGGR